MVLGPHSKVYKEHFPPKLIFELFCNLFLLILAIFLCVTMGLVEQKCKDFLYCFFVFWPATF